MRLPRHAEIWLPGYVQARARSLVQRQGNPRRWWVAICDHYEPMWLRPDDATARQRVAAWSQQWPLIAARHRDSSGRKPKHTFFFPQEEYRAEFLDPLAEMTRAGVGDVEVHLHHDREGEQDFVDRIRGFVEVLRDRHGLLHEENGRTVFAFIHGNWALDNSLPGGERCGLNNELTLLRDLGCYADFTMPSGNSYSQARTVNTIYWVTDDPARPKSYDHGVPVRVGGSREGDLMMVTGPIGIRWRERLTPRVETGELAWQDRATRYRVRRWVDLAPRLGDDVFIKLYTHGAQERNSRVLLDGGALDEMFSLLAEAAGQCGARWFSVSAWEMYQAIEAIRQQRDPLVAIGRG